MRSAVRWWCALAVLMCLCAGGVFAADQPGNDGARQDRLLREKAGILVEKAQKAERQGEYAEAVEAYEDAYEAFPGNVTPLLAWGDLLCRLGQYDHSKAVLKRIPMNLLPPAGRARVNRLFAKIAVSAGDLEQSAILLGDVLKDLPDDAGSRVRLALMNDLFGFESRKMELIRDQRGRDALSYRDRTILFLLELGCLKLIDAFENAGRLSSQLADLGKSSEGGLPWSVTVQRYTIVSFLTALPLGLADDAGIAYALLLIGILMMIANRLAPDASVRGNVVFALLAITHIAVTRWAGMPDARMAMLVDAFSLYDSIWILPRLLVAMHIVTLTLFAVFPLFSLLPSQMRPKRNELFAVWFFCWWFMTFVLIFQSRLDIVMRLTGMLASGVCIVLAAVWMPLGKFLLFQCAKVTGFSRMMPAIRLMDGEGESFSDAKLQEAQAVSRLEAEDFSAVILNGKRLFLRHDRGAFPEMHLAMMRAYLEQEDLYECRKMLLEFQRVFGDSRHASSGMLLEALMKSFAGDYAGALQTINAIPEAHAASLGGDDTALSLLVTGRCNMSMGHPHQARLDWKRALEYARLPLVRAAILSEMVVLDAADGLPEWTAKWRAAAESLGGGDKTRAYVQMIRSVDFHAAGRANDALREAAAACDAFARCGPAFAWHGHLLCLAGRYADAQALLEKMSPGAASSQRLMEEITALG